MGSYKEQRRGHAQPVPLYIAFDLPTTPNAKIVRSEKRLYQLKLFYTQHMKIFLIAGVGSKHGKKSYKYIILQ